MKIGIMGGTFDPIHIAHLVVAEDARARLKLTVVIFVPAGEPQLKVDPPECDGQTRLEMVRLATEKNPFFVVSDSEINRQGPTFTVDTLEHLSKEWGPDADFYFIMGLDALMGLPRWRQPEQFLRLCTPVVFNRPDYRVADLGQLRENLPTLTDKLVVIQGPGIEISSSEIRSRVAIGRPIRDLVPDEVEKYIDTKGLYRGIKERGS